MLKRLIIVSLAFGLQAAYAFDAVRLSYGEGKPKNLQGGRLAVDCMWPAKWGENHPWYLTGYWDSSLAYWTTDGDDVRHRNRDVGIVAAAPVFRYRKTTPWHDLIPYAELSVGAAALTDNRLAQRDLGSHFLFQDIMGFGTRFGGEQQFDFGLHYLHYSNANLASHNAGIDVKVLASLAYLTA